MSQDSILRISALRDVQSYLVLAGNLTGYGPTLIDLLYTIETPHDSSLGLYLHLDTPRVKILRNGTYIISFSFSLVF